MSTRSRRPRALEALAPVDRLCRAAGDRVRWLAAPFAFLLFAAIALGQERVHPLKPADRSSPRATLKTLSRFRDAVAAFLARDYLPSPSRAKFQRLLSLGEIPQQYLDLSEVPPAARQKTGRAAAVALVRDPEQDPASASRRDPRRRSGQAARRHRPDALGDPEHRDRPRSRAERAAQRRVPVQRRDRCPGGRLLRAGSRIALCPSGPPRKRARDLHHRRGLDGSVRLDSERCRRRCAPRSPARRAGSGSAWP